MSSFRSNRESRGSSFRGNRGASAYASFSLPPDRDILEGLNISALSTLKKPSQASTGKEIKIKNQEYIGSYNWTSAPEGQPTIIVPGM